jgi:nitronate monooxygenase
MSPPSREAKAAASAGADVVVVQGSEAGGHRGCFDAAEAERGMVGLISLVPTVVDAVKIPVVATGGVQTAAASQRHSRLGRAPCKSGPAFLRCPEAAIARAWAKALEDAAPEATVISRAFSGRAGRSLATGYVRAALEPQAPPAAPYPVQRGLTQAMRSDAMATGDIERMQAWAGQSASLARAVPAGRLVAELWNKALSILE